MGLHRAGFDPYGMDNKLQPHYPFPFLMMDALEAMDRLLRGEGLTFSNGETLYLADFAAYWASPPCQKFTALRTMHNAKEHDDLLTPTRERLLATGKPYIIENVPGAPMMGPYIILCGTMFGLGTGAAELRRHRLFELEGFYLLVPGCMHYQRHLVIGVYGGHGRDRRRTVGVYGDGNGRDYRKHPAVVGVGGHAGGLRARDGTQQFTTDQRREAMGIDWMNGDELSQAIPPAYSNYIGKQLLRALADRATKGNAPAGEPGR